MLVNAESHPLQDDVYCWCFCGTSLYFQCVEVADRRHPGSCAGVDRHGCYSFGLVESRCHSAPQHLLNDARRACDRTQLDLRPLPRSSNGPPQSGYRAGPCLQQQCVRCPPVQAVLPTKEGHPHWGAPWCGCGYRCGALTCGWMSTTHAWWPKSVGMLIAEATLIGVLTAVAPWAGRRGRGRTSPWRRWSLSRPCGRAIRRSGRQGHRAGGRSLCLARGS